jgi:hypothetical protein
MKQTLSLKGWLAVEWLLSAWMSDINLKNLEDDFFILSIWTKGRILVQQKRQCYFFVIIKCKFMLLCCYTEHNIFIRLFLETVVND